MAQTPRNETPDYSINRTMYETLPSNTPLSMSRETPNDSWRLHTFRCLGTLFCFRKMSKSSRVRLTWFWITVLSVGSGLSLAYAKFGSNHLFVSPTDMRIVPDSQISTIFCEAVRLDSSTVSFDSYLIDFGVSLGNQRQLFNVTDTKTIGSTTHTYYSFYLLEGSTLSVKACTIIDCVIFYVIEGKNNLDRWLADDCDECYVYSTTFCNGCDFQFIYKIDIFQTDEYFVAYKSSYNDATLTTNLYLNRALYDTSHYTQRCMNTFACRFDFDMVHTLDVVYHIKAQSLDSSTELSVHCEPRIWIFTLFFLVFPIIIGIMITFGIVALDRRPMQVPQSSHVNMPTQVQRPVVSRTAETPKYEDITPLLATAPSTNEPGSDDPQITKDHGGPL